MLALYAARIEDLGVGDFVKIDCAACHHVALLTPEALMRVGLSPGTKMLDLRGFSQTRIPDVLPLREQFRSVPGSFLRADHAFLR